MKEQIISENTAHIHDQKNIDNYSYLNYQEICRTEIAVTPQWRANPQLKMNELLILWLEQPDTQMLIEKMCSIDAPQIPLASPATNKSQPMKKLHINEAKVNLREYFGEKLKKSSNKELNISTFTELLKKVLSFPTFISRLLFKKLATSLDAALGIDHFLQYWESNLEKLDFPARLFQIIKTNHSSSSISVTDLTLLVKEIVQSHPFFDFVRETDDDTEMHYSNTVVTRILYHLIGSKKSFVTLPAFKRKRFAQTLVDLDDMADINQELNYFSYEHFYVIFCKFSELDKDRDQLLRYEDLVQYGEGALNPLAVERIMKQPSFDASAKGLMCYQDFIWFILSEEDKTTDTSAQFWFNCLDLDGDGVVSSYEMEVFYEEQQNALENLYLETISWDDLSCQIFDMIKPIDTKAITLRDIKQSKQAPYIFNALFNVSKFFHSERDPYPSTAKYNETETCWDAFAKVEFEKRLQVGDS